MMMTLTIRPLLAVILRIMMDRTIRAHSNLVPISSSRQSAQQIGEVRVDNGMFGLSKLTQARNGTKIGGVTVHPMKHLYSFAHIASCLESVAVPACKISRIKCHRTPPDDYNFVVSLPGGPIYPTRVRIEREHVVS